MTREAMVERRTVHRLENSGSGADDITVENHRDAREPGSNDRPCHCRDLAPAKTAQDFQRIGEIVFMARDGGRYGGGFSGKSMAVNACAVASPICRGAAVKGMIDGRGDRRIADPHFAET